MLGLVPSICNDWIGRDGLDPWDKPKDDGNENARPQRRAFSFPVLLPQHPHHRPLAHEPEQPLHIL